MILQGCDVEWTPTLLLLIGEVTQSRWLTIVGSLLINIEHNLLLVAVGIVEGSRLKTLLNLGNHLVAVE